MSSNKLYDAAVIGAGPAGASAALYIMRANLSAAVFHSGAGSLARAQEIGNYYGLERPLSGLELYETGLEQLRALGAQLIADEVVGVRFDGEKYTVATSSFELDAKAVVLAMGSARKSKNIEGLAQFEGSGVSYCAVCDAFFFKNKRVAVLGAGEFALHEANELVNTAASVTILTDGEQPAFEADGFEVITNAVARLSGGERLERVEFTSGSTLDIDGLFVALGSADSASLARSIGAVSENGKIQTNADMSTTVPGLFAAGDCTGGLLQVSKAVCDGAYAGLACAAYIRKLKQ